MTPDPPAVRITLTTPPHWWDLPLDPASGADDLEQLVADRARSLGDGVDVGAVTATLRRAAASAHGLGAVFASQFGLSDEGLDYGASLLVAVHPDRAGGHLPGPEPGAGESDVDVRTVALGSLGRVTRRLSRLRVGDPASGGVDTCLAQYFAAVPGAAATVVITGSAVGAGDLQSVGEMFDAIVATVSVSPG